MNGYSHGGEDHSSPKEEEVENTKEQFDERGLELANSNYLKTVKAIFVKKCFDCHSSSKDLPWYSRLPLIGYIVKEDRKEGLTHLNLTNDFPFGGHGGPIKDLKAIQESIEKDSMPPFLYKAFHWKSGLTKKEIEEVNEWIRNSLESLKASKK